MTHIVLQSDIDLAKELIAAGCEESRIVAWLCWRGVDREKAATLVRDLFYGRKPHGFLPGYLTDQRRHGSGRHKRAPRYTTARPASLRISSHRHRRSYRRVVKNAFRWGAGITASIFILFCFAYVGLHLYEGITEATAALSEADRIRLANIRRYRDGFPRPVADFNIPRPSKSSADSGDPLTALGLPPLPTVDRLRLPELK